MVSRRYLTIDTSVRPNESHDFTLYLNPEIGNEYRKMCLKSVYVQNENDVAKLFSFTVNENTVFKPLYVHCSMLNKDDNFVNGRYEGSDILGVIYPTESQSQKSMLVKFSNNSGKLISRANHIRLHLTNFKGEPVDHQTKYFIIYEIEFFSNLNDELEKFFASRDELEKFFASRDVLKKYFS